MRALLLALAVAGCGSTGGDLIGFSGRAGGPSSANGPAEFDVLNSDGTLRLHYALSKATFHIAAVYLNSTRPTAGGAEQPCVLPGIYDGEVFGSCDGATCGIDVDLLSAELVPFQLPGHGTATEALEAQLWLTGVSDINADSDPTPILQVAGTATNAAQSWPFSATVTIGANRKKPTGNPAFPGLSPICAERIVGPFPVDFTLSEGGTLDLRVDPSRMFDDVDLTQLTATDGTYVIPDVSSGTDAASVAGNALFQNGLKKATPYQLTWTPK